jgi:hypothetical protein
MCWLLVQAWLVWRLPAGSPRLASTCVFSKQETVSADACLLHTSLDSIPRLNSFDAFVTRLSDPDVSEEDKRAACSYVRGFHAAHPQEISVQSLIEGMEAEEKIDGNISFRLPQGYDRIVRLLENRISVKNASIELNSRVTAVRWAPRSVEVEVERSGGANSTLSSSSLLCTLPLELLKLAAKDDGAIRFKPPIAAKQEVLSKLRVGHVIRVSLAFRKCFWAEMSVQGKSLSTMNFLFSQDPVFPTWWGPIRSVTWPLLSKTHCSLPEKPLTTKGITEPCTELSRVDIAQRKRFLRVRCGRMWREPSYQLTEPALTALPERRFCRE